MIFKKNLSCGAKLISLIVHTAIAVAFLGQQKFSPVNKTLTTEQTLQEKRTHVHEKKNAPREMVER